MSKAMREIEAPELEQALKDHSMDVALVAKFYGVTEDKIYQKIGELFSNSEVKALIELNALFMLWRSMPRLAMLAEEGNKDALSALIKVSALSVSANVMVKTKEGEWGEVSLNRKDWGMLEGGKEIAHLPTVEMMEQEQQQKKKRQHPKCAEQGCLMHGGNKK